MPTLNQSRYIREAIDSVLTQDYPAVELIVVDGQSTDGTLDILRSYGDRITWRSEKDRNLAEAINKGIRASRGDYIHSLASDEILLPGALTSLVRHAEAGGADIVIAQGFVIDESSAVVGTITVPNPCPFEEVLTLRTKLPFAFSFFRRAVCERYPFDEDFRVCTDFMFWLTVLEHTRVVFVPDRVGCWRRQPEAWSVRPEAVRTMFDARLQALAKYFAANPARKSWYPRGYIGACADVMEHHFQRERYPAALGVFLDSVRRYPFASLRHGWLWQMAYESLLKMLVGRRRRRTPGSRKRSREPERVG
jgi:cellulose synthase/poly-beta-1,6-N-acetylglucosamine synthase-like glycosyltransferase